MSHFPSGWFYIQSKCSHKMVLDVTQDSLKAAAKVIVWPKKTKDNDNQLWMYDHGYIINKNSGMVLDVQGGVIESDKQIIQYRRKMVEDAHNQRWNYRDDGFIYLQANPNLVLDIRGNWTKPGTVVLLYERKYKDNLNQLWDLIPYESVSDQSSVLSPSIQSQGTEVNDDDDYAFSSASYAL
ncbi:ricin B-like lectin [Rhizopus microsporus ATCC 52813]|uniref:Ricin B-like lectin n=1 Tax=Rhizopus microsporus ATCC 52813 TaxID=1340429 RepID=A0A2G4SGD4_RHIZD|nr:ricin B-like lectin [Rhizopus microsporus ATCC 52813]PHZ07823.1 ricin B-like lectin [Rhizopus microsporus ATCC 52813]